MKSKQNIVQKTYLNMFKEKSSVIKESKYVDIDTSTYTFLNDEVKCPNCGSVNCEPFDQQEELDEEPYLQDQIQIKNICNDCKCMFKHTFKPVLVDIEILDNRLG